MNKFAYLGIGLLAGAGIGAGITYIITKSTCEKHTQDAIEDMKRFYETETSKEVKGFRKEEANEEKERDVVRKDKPPISEMSSLHNSNSDNPVGFTNYNLQNNIGDEKKEKEVDNKIESLKSKIKHITEEIPAAERFAIIEHSEYIKKCNSGYSDKDYSFDTDTEEWIDEMAGVPVELEDLPFDPELVDGNWNDLEQCYIADEQLRCVYMLEKI